MTKIKQPKLSAEMPQKMPPEVSFDKTELPEIKNWKVGGKYELKLKVEQISIGKDTMDNEKELRARFKVLEVAAIGKEDLYGNYKNPNKL